MSHYWNVNNNNNNNRHIQMELESILGNYFIVNKAQLFNNFKK